MTLDLFCGIGGWGQHRGVDTSRDVAATRSAAGLDTLVADVSMVPDVVVRSTFAGVEGIVGSPPCPPFSATGNGQGVKDIELLEQAIEGFGQGQDCRRQIRALCADDRSILAVEPLRWVLLLEPEWCAWEQVIGAAPVWRAAAQVLADHDYSVWTGILDANDYGVAQSRRRAILMASKTRLVSCPRAHPVSATGLSVIADVVDPPTSDAVLRMGRSRGTKRNRDQPAPTIMFGKSPNDVGWYRPDGSFIESLSIEDALRLQGFRADYPLAGGKVSRYRQVGDAVPRPLAEAVLEGLRPRPADLRLESGSAGRGDARELARA